MWVWMVGGIIIGLFIFSISSMYVFNLVEDKEVREMLTSFDFIKNKVDMWCYVYPGSKSEENIFSISKNFERMFVVSMQTYLEYQNDPSIEVLNAEPKGDVLCLEYEGSRPRCYKLKCTAIMKELSKDDSIIQGLLDEGIPVQYRFVLNKLRDGVEINYMLIE